MSKFRLKREKYDVFDSGLATILFVILQNLFLLLYGALPSSIKGIAIVGILASFGIELMFALAGYLTSAIRGVDFFSASKLNKKINWKIVGITLLIALISIFGFNALSNYFIMFLESVGYKTSLSNIAIGNFPTYLLYLFLVAVVPAVFEEICFRGTICAGLIKTNKHLAVWVSALIFMLMHGGPEQTIHQFILGVIFGYVFVYTGNLWVTILIHFFNNAIAVTMMYMQTLMMNGAENVGEVTEEVVGFAGLSGVEIVTTVMTACLTAVSAGVLIFCLTKSLITQCKELEQKKEKILAENGEIVEASTEECVADEFVQTIKQSNNIAPIVMIVVSSAWLIFEWVMALISGFGL